MADSGSKGATIGSILHSAIAVAALAGWLGLNPVAGSTARAADNPASALSQGDKKCLACHASEGLNKPLGNGETLALQGHGDAFANSVHAPLGRATCHA